MGRQIRRVPLDFDWPLNKTWDGFVNPHWRECPEVERGNCHNGEDNNGAWLTAISHLIAGVGREGATTPEEREALRGRGCLSPHPYLTQWGQAPHTRGRSGEAPRMVVPDARMAEFVAGLSGGDHVDRWSGSEVAYGIRRKLIKAAKMPEDWGCCLVCGGTGQDPATLPAYEAWKPTPPPTGEGWQLWENTSEGSPVSIVFTSEGAFENYLVNSHGMTRASARAFMVATVAPTFVAAMR